MANSSHADRSIAAVFALGGAAVCLAYGLIDHGIYHPDEIYQTLEPAHRLVYGSGLTTWEWRVGARNWTLPAVLSVGFWPAEWLGFDGSSSHLVGPTMLVCAATAASSLGVYRLARSWRVRPVIANTATALFALSPAVLYFGHRPLAEVVSAPFVVWGLALALDRRESRRRSTLGVSLLGIAILLRLHNALFALALVLIHRVRGEGEAYRRAVDVLAVWGLIYGAIDWATWGIPFQSAGAYLRANLIMGVTTDYYAASPPGLLVGALVATCGPALVVWGVGAAFSTRRAPALALVTIGFVGLHQLFPHRQLRFVYPALPLLAALGAVGWDVLVERYAIAPRRVLAGAFAVGIAGLGWGLYATPRLTLGDVGQSDVLRADASRSAHQFRHDVNMLLSRAGERDDLCGLYVREPWIVKTGGATYLHRGVPIYHRLQRPPSREVFNYAILRDEGGRKEESAARKVAGQGAFALVKTGEACADDPDYEPRADALESDGSEG